MQRTLSIRIDEEDYNFVKKIAKEHQEEISKSVRELVNLGRLMFALDQYKKSKISIGKAAEVAGVSISEMMNMLSEFGIPSNVTYEDYLEGLETARKLW